jgi:hypothetical protein
VVDINKLKGQQFFANGKNGDKIIIYSKANKAILFRPTTNKIIEVAPIKMNTATQPAVKIGILNGDKTGDKMKAIEKDVTARINNVTITKKRAALTQYKTTFVVDVQGTKPEMAQQLAQFVGGEVSQLAAKEVLSAEEKAAIDILIVVGEK